MSSTTIKVTNTKLTPATQTYIEKKLKALDPFLHEENDVHVELDIQTHSRTGRIYHVEITIMPRPGIFAEAEGEDLYEAFDLALPKIKEQLVKKKDRTVSSRRRDGAKSKRG